MIRKISICPEKFSMTIFYSHKHFDDLLYSFAPKFLAFFLTFCEIYEKILWFTKIQGYIPTGFRGCSILGISRDIQNGISHWPWSRSRQSEGYGGWSLDLRRGGMYGGREWIRIGFPKEECFEWKICMMRRGRVMRRTTVLCRTCLQAIYLGNAAIDYISMQVKN